MERGIESKCNKLLNELLKNKPNTKENRYQCLQNIKKQLQIEYPEKTITYSDENSNGIYNSLILRVIEYDDEILHIQLEQAEQ